MTKTSDFTEAFVWCGKQDLNRPGVKNTDKQKCENPYFIRSLANLDKSRITAKNPKSLLNYIHLHSKGSMITKDLQ